MSNGKTEAKSATGGRSGVLTGYLPCPFCGEQPAHEWAYGVSTVKCENDDCPIAGKLIREERWQKRKDRRMCEVTEFCYADFNHTARAEALEMELHELRQEKR